MDSQVIGILVVVGITIFSSVYESIKKSRAERSRRARENGPAAVPAPPVPAPVPPRQPSVPRRRAAAPPPAPAPPQRQPVSPPLPAEGVRSTSDTPPVRPPAEPRPALTLRQLRERIIWGEILAPRFRKY